MSRPEWAPALDGDPVKQAMGQRAGWRCEMPVEVRDEDRFGRERWLRERCWETAALQFSHRVRASQGGPRTIANGQLICPQCHAWLDRDRAAAVTGGWQLDAGTDYHEAPIWLLDPYPAWWLLREAGSDAKHLLELHSREPGPEVFRRVEPVTWAA